MPVVQRVDHPAKNIEKLIVGGVLGDFRSVGRILLLPVDLPEFEEWIPFVKGLPQRLEILFRIAIAHAGVDLCVTQEGCSAIRTYPPASTARSDGRSAALTGSAGLPS